MEFGIIYSVDIPEDQRLRNYLPRAKIHRKMRVMESKNRGGDLAYAGLGKHRRYCALFTKEQFEQFVDDCGLYATDTETGGILGAPWSNPWYGCAPAISFDGEDDYGMINAYVTPLPTWEPKSLTAEKEERWFKMIKDAVVRRYGRKQHRS